MRNSIKIVLVGAIALAGAVACSPKESVTPNYNPATGEVATSFVFSVSTANSPMTKQTSANTQATATDAFRGITDARLLSFLPPGRSLRSDSVISPVFRISTM